MTEPTPVANDAEFALLRALDEQADFAGWATAHDVGVALGRSRGSVATSMVHARNAGLVESRSDPDGPVQLWGLTELGGEVVLSG